MAKEYGRALRWGLAAVVAAAALAVILIPGLPALGWWRGAPLFASVLVPIPVSLLVAVLVTDHARRAALDRRARAALDGHSMRYELTWLMVLLLGFTVATVAVSNFAAALFHGVSWEILMPPVRILFLFVLPLLVVDRGGFTTSGHGTVMPRVAMRVTDRWRWAGLFPVGVNFALIAAAVFPVPAVPAGLVLGAALAIFAAVAVPEEIFYRALLQTRLERLLGRWGGILATSVVFTAVSVFLAAYGDSTTEAATVSAGVLESVVVYGAAGIVYGYVWSCYRNIWLSILFRGGSLLLAIIPELRLL
ncbi:CPBP family intramembrane metalloprotease [Streptomonospora sp. S1-112]|uniref:CPBP family intramembrane metalloprotease n=1 Tax=Streptomonospora mangrovi TaxID=2883123 RepID=A0A9X3NL49_9ACTN|nr:CPBP family intramembrane glutamic endopeptidase [Streptomonospora mangrovi]MDA0565502.1 CPBP family intramembrane metalloprotease [Streptomonospora mangrovi]